MYPKILSENNPENSVCILDVPCASDLEGMLTPHNIEKVSSSGDSRLL